MSEFCTSESIKARKPHKCDVCGVDIIKGMSHVRSSGVFDGQWWSSRAHHDCADMHCHHNDGRSPDDQCDDYYLDEYRGRWPHVVCRFELRQQLKGQK